MIAGHAVALAEAGYSVFPVNGKHPLSDSNGCLDATRDLEVVSRWWDSRDDLGIGIATGEPSRVWVLDVDGPAGRESLRRLIREHGELPETVTARTKNGGHLYFKMPPNGDVRNSAGKIAPGLDVRGTGGYVVAPPSSHPDGGGYVWKHGRSPDDISVAEAPDWLLALVAGPVADRSPAPPAADVIPQGKRNESLASIAGTMRNRGLDAEEIGSALLAVNGRRCNPPLPDSEVMLIARSIARYPPAPLPEPKDTSTATQPVPDAEAETYDFEDFHAYLPEHRYIFTPTGDLWPTSSVDASLPKREDPETGQAIKASAYLDRHRSVEQMTWAPGEESLIRDRLVSQGGWIPKAGCSVFNLYRPPQIRGGDATQAGPWLDHVWRVYPIEAEHLLAWQAHRVQRPGEKINHALVLGGLQGIGKDTLLEALKFAVGPWNFTEVSPAHLLGRFNGFVKSVILRVSEARDLGDVDRYGFYEHMKAYTAAPPDVLRCDEKNIREYSVLNVCGVVITTNHKSSGIYLPADDRRHFVAWSELTKDDFDDGYWRRIWGWYRDGGISHVAAYLREYDLSGFDPKAPPPKTSAFWDIVDANRAPEDAELADVLDKLQTPRAITLDDLARHADTAFSDWINDRRNRRQMPHRMEGAGYVRVRNESAKDGLWKVNGKRQAIYAQRELPVRDRLDAVNYLVEAARR